MNPNSNAVPREAGKAGANHVEKLRDLLGRDVVLLPIAPGTKSPTGKGWQRRTLDVMNQPGHLERLATGNIGVLQGEPSNGLCSIDIDSDEAVAGLLQLNPAFKNTLQSRGARGRNIWLRIKGEYPKMTKLRHHDGREWGEWRATGGQTVIHGKHPSGCNYQIINEAKLIEIAFDEIVWPEDLVLPWATALYEELVRQQGEPFFVKKNSIKLNEMFFVAKFALEHLVLYEPDEGQFYTYDENRGLWKPSTDESIKNHFALDLKAYADTQGEARILEHRTNGLLTALTSLLKGHVEKRGVFKKSRGIIHVANGMARLDLTPPELREFSPEYYSRNQCPIALVEGADCPRFKTELLASALDADDISLIQRYCGSLLLGGNPAQRLLLLTGTAGGGKSTLAEIVESVVGEENVVELRTEQLGDRFEIGRFLGKTVLTGKDVPPEFLMRKGASNLKKLVGHDLLSAERKGSNTAFNLRGEFAVLITCNSRLRVLLEGDADAWRRRLLLVEYNRPKPKMRIAEFAKQLQREEGPGILNWMIEGALRHLHELRTTGDFILTKAQEERIETLLAESDSLRQFVRKCVRPAETNVTVDQLAQYYEFFCEDMGYQPISKYQVCSKLPDLVAEIHRVHKRNDIKTTDGVARGFKGLDVGRAE